MTNANTVAENLTTIQREMRRFCGVSAEMVGNDLHVTATARKGAAVTVLTSDLRIQKDYNTTSRLARNRADEAARMARELGWS